MKFFVDTADIGEIRELASAGMIDGVTTNPTLVAKSGKKFIPLIEEICKVVEGPVSAEVASTEFESMLHEARRLASTGMNIAVKVPATYDGLKVCKALSNEGVMVNVTLCFSAAQALLAAKAGATFISPFIGRLEDIGEDGIGLIRDIVAIYGNYPEIRTQVLAASIRTPQHVVECAKIGAHVATCPPKIIKELYKHPLTDKGLEIFLADWEKSGQTIL